MVNRMIIAAAVGAAVAVGAVGIWLGSSGSVDLFADEAGAAATPGAFSFHACPNEDVLGELRGGDRVYLTGRDASGEWVEVRSPAGQGSVWVRADVVDPDRDAELPTIECHPTELALSGSGVVPPPTTLPEEAPDGDEPGDDTTPTTEPAPPTTERPGPPVTQPPAPPTTQRPAPPTTQRPAPPTTQRPPVTQPPVTQPPVTQPPAPAPAIGPITRSSASIVEQWAGFPNTCGGAKTSTISASISGATSATMSWSGGGLAGSRGMARQGSTFSAALGPFDENAVDPPPSTVSLTVTITAHGPGGSHQRSTAVSLADCFFG